MSYKSSTPPLCRNCGKPIAKATRFRWFRVYKSDTTYNDADTFVMVDHYPASREEAQRYFNERIVSVRRGVPPTSTDQISVVYTWDGESYRDEFFCKNDCAIGFARSAARQGLVETGRWREARAKQLKKQAKGEKEHDEKEHETT